MLCNGAIQGRKRNEVSHEPTSRSRDISTVWRNLASKWCRSWRCRRCCSWRLLLSQTVTYPAFFVILEVLHVANWQNLREYWNSQARGVRSRIGNVSRTPRSVSLLGCHSQGAYCTYWVMLFTAIYHCCNARLL